MTCKTIYPFVAIVGQEQMKLALYLNLINSTLSGVLIRGEKGTAKSTAVRALADILHCGGQVVGHMRLEAQFQTNALGHQGGKGAAVLNNEHFRH